MPRRCVPESGAQRPVLATLDPLRGDAGPPAGESFRAGEPGPRGGRGGPDAGGGGGTGSAAGPGGGVRGAAEGVGEAGGAGRVRGAAARLLHDRPLVRTLRPADGDDQAVHGGQRRRLELNPVWFNSSICYTFSTRARLRLFDRRVSTT